MSNKLNEFAKKYFVEGFGFEVSQHTNELLGGYYMVQLCNDTDSFINIRDNMSHCYSHLAVALNGITPRLNSAFKPKYLNKSCKYADFKKALDESGLDFKKEEICPRFDYRTKK